MEKKSRKHKSAAKTATVAVAPAAPAPPIDMTPIGSVSEPQVDPGALAKSYCGAIAESVNEARAKGQAARLRELEGALEKRIAELTARLDDLRAFAAAREDAARKAEENVLAIYAKMKPESAAAQLSAMDEMSAAAILARLPARAASLILNEVSADKAARLANAMAPRKLAPPPDKNSDKASSDRAPS